MYSYGRTNLLGILDNSRHVVSLVGPRPHVKATTVNPDCNRQLGVSFHRRVTNDIQS